MTDDLSSRRDSQVPMAASLTLGETQRWLQAAICSADVQSTGEVETSATGANWSDFAGTDVLLPSRALSVDERLDIYRHAYVARLVECLRAQFPLLRAAAGDDAFGALAVGYLQAHPSQSYTLNRLGDRLADYLRATRPPRDVDQLDWADLLADLAALEWTIDEVFDGPGEEAGPPLDLDQVHRIASEDCATLRVRLSTSLRLLQTGFPLHGYTARLRDAVEAGRRNAIENANVAVTETEYVDLPTSNIELPPMPEPATSWMAIVRRNYVVWRYPLSQPQFVTLQALQRGETLNAAMEEAREAAPQWDESALAAAVQAWFTEWTTNGLIVGLDVVA